MIPPRVAIFDKTYSPIAAKFAPAFESFTIIVDGFAASSGIIATSGLTFVAYGGLTARAALSGTSFLFLNSSGNIIGRAFLNVTSSLSFNANATITAQFASGLYGTSAVQFAVAGALKGKASIAGAGIVSFLPATTLTAKARFTSAITISTQAAGAIRGAASVFGTSQIQFTGAATLTAVQPGLYGSAGIAFAQAAAVRGITSASSAVSISFAQSGVVRGKSSITAASSLAFTQSATLGSRVSINGTSTLAFAPTGAIRGTARSTAPSVLNFAQTGAIKGRGRFTGTSAATFTPAASIANAAGSGTLVSYGTPSSGFVQSPTGTYSGQGYAVATGSLAVNANAQYDTEWATSQNSDVVIGISDNSTNNAYTNFAFGFFVYSATGTYSYTLGTGSIINTGVTPAAGDRYGVRITNRATSATYVYGYTRGGVWVPLYTNTAITGVNVTIYFKADIAGASSKLLNPKTTPL